MNADETQMGEETADAAMASASGVHLPEQGQPRSRSIVDLRFICAHLRLCFGAL